MNSSKNEETTTQEQGRFGLTAAEYADLKAMLRNALAIFVAVAVALTVVALVSGMING